MAKRSRILALDIGSSTLKLAEFSGSKSGDLELSNFAMASLGMDPSAEAERNSYFETTLQELLHENNIKPGPVVISVAGQSVFSRFVKLPPVESDKVFQIIQYEAQQNVPFPMDEVVWDYQLVGGGGGEIEVMLAAIKAEIIEEITDVVQRAGLHTELVDVAPMTLFNTVRYNYPDEEGATLIVDIGARSTDLIFMEGSRVFIRSVPVAGNAITLQVMKEFDLEFADAEEMKRSHAFVSFGAGHEQPGDDVANRVSQCVRNVMTRMHAEINRSINFYRSQQGGSAPSLVLLTGGSAVIPYTDAFLKEKLKVEVNYLNPFADVAVGPAISEDQVGRYIHQLGEVVGLGLRQIHQCPIEINLLPASIIEERDFRKKQPILLAAMVALVLTLAVWSAYFYKLSSIATERRAQVKSEVQALLKVEGRLKGAEMKLEKVQGQIDQLLSMGEERTDWLRILDAIHECTPEGMWITHIRKLATARDEQNNPNREAPQANPVTKLELSGKGYIDKVPSRGALIEFRDRLRKKPEFSEETEIQWAPDPGKNYTRDFKIVAWLAQKEGGQE